jgi:leukotriene-A4 hydrolase
MQWLQAHQTAGKKHPLFFTQCEAILARTLVPCQDTPSVKTPYQISVRNKVTLQNLIVTNVSIGKCSQSFSSSL